MAEKSSVNWLAIAAAIVGTAILAGLPIFVSGYGISSGITIFANIALATAWAFFSGPTRYISLATASFVGIGMYTVVISGNYVPLSFALLLAALIGFGIALIVGLSTLRLSGVYFVIFTFGLTELLMQLATWYEISFSRRLTRFMPAELASIDSSVIYEILLFAMVFTLAATWYVGRTRLGQALRAIGEDETVARHTGINTTLVKVFVFAFASGMMAFIGGALALRLPYITPSIAFNPTWSFQVLIAALLGGPGFFWGPAVGAVPLVLLSDYFSGTFPYHFSIALGLCFVIIVYLIPGGIAPRLASWYHRLSHAKGAQQGREHFTRWRHDLSLWRRTELRPRLRGIKRKAPAASFAESDAAPLLRVTDLRKAFGGLVAVRDLSFDIPKGSIVGLIGPNGSGKTTVLNLITGELVPDSGSILLDGEETIGALSYQVNRARIARTFQLVRVLPGMTTQENVALGRMFGSDPVAASAASKEVGELLARVGLAGHATQFGAQLTYIDQKRVELARALATHPQLLLLDEWLAGLNPTELKVGIELIRQISKEGVTIVLVEHVMEAIRALCQHVVVMNAGEKIAEGTPAEVLSDPRVMQVYLGEDDAAA